MYEVVEVDLLRPVRQDLKGFQHVKEIFRENVDRAVNTKLTYDFRNQLQENPVITDFVRRGDFDDMALSSVWFFFGQLKNGTIVGLNIVADSTRKLTMKSFFVQPNSLFIPTYTIGEINPDTINEFINIASQKLKAFIEGISTAVELERTKQKLSTRNTVNIGLDYDGTVTSDYYAFFKLVELFRNRGHKVYIVTMRYESECRQDANFMRLAEISDGWCATGRMAKRKYCEQQGLKIHIWIDDNPIAVEKDAIDIWGSVSPEGSVVIEEHGTKLTNGE